MFCVMFLTCIMLALGAKFASFLMIISVGFGDPDIHLV